MWIKLFLSLLHDAQTQFIQAYKFEPRQYNSNTIQMTIKSTKHIYKAHT